FLKYNGSLNAQRSSNMKQFAVQAIVDERVLWDIMTMLERAKAHGIMARPIAVALTGDEAAPRELPPPRKDKRISGPGLRVRETIKNILSTQRTVTMREVKAINTGFTTKFIAQQLYMLMVKGELRRTKVGVYVKRKGR